MRARSLMLLAIVGCGQASAPARDGASALSDEDAAPTARVDAAMSHEAAPGDAPLAPAPDSAAADVTTAPAIDLAPGDVRAPATVVLDGEKLAAAKRRLRAG